MKIIVVQTGMQGTDENVLCMFTSIMAVQLHVASPSWKQRACDSPTGFCYCVLRAVTGSVPITDKLLSNNSKAYTQPPINLASPS